MTATDHIAGLQPQHLKKLRACGLSDETITKAGIYSEVAPAKIAAILRRKRPWKNIAPAIIIPFYSACLRIGC